MRSNKYDSRSSNILPAVAQMFASIWQQAHRDNRRIDRETKHRRKYTSYRLDGLNGNCAVERRQRQIACGQLTSANGLVEQIR